MAPPPVRLLLMKVATPLPWVTSNVVCKADVAGTFRGLCFPYVPPDTVRPKAKRDQVIRAEHVVCLALALSWEPRLQLGAVPGASI